MLLGPNAHAVRRPQNLGLLRGCDIGTSARTALAR
jgi:hypothetical protein